LQNITVKAASIVETPGFSDSLLIMLCCVIYYATLFRQIKMFWSVVIYSVHHFARTDRRTSAIARLWLFQLAWLSASSRQTAHSCPAHVCSTLDTTATGSSSCPDSATAARARV